MPKFKPKRSLRKGKHRKCESSRARVWLVRTLVTKTGGRCEYCRQPVAREDLTVDHVIPLASGGLDRLDNLRLACSKCNAEKGAGVAVDVFIATAEDEEPRS